MRHLVTHHFSGKSYLVLAKVFVLYNVKYTFLGKIIDQMLLVDYSKKIYVLQISQKNKLVHLCMSTWKIMEVINKF